MKGLFAAADEYVRHCTWRDMALLKCCLCAMGVLLGMAVPARRRKLAAWGAVAVFLASYVPLMAKFLPFLTVRQPAGGDKI